VGRPWGRVALVELLLARGADPIEAGAEPWAHRSRGLNASTAEIASILRNTELTDSGSQSLTISGYHIARRLARSRSGRALHRQARANRVSAVRVQIESQYGLAVSGLFLVFRKWDLRGRATTIICSLATRCVKDRLTVLGTIFATAHAAVDEKSLDFPLNQLSHDLQ